MIGHHEAPMTIEDCRSATKNPHLGFYNGHWAVEHGYQPDRAFRMRPGQNWKGEPFTRIWFWTGRFRGYGYTDVPSHFCNHHEAALFGLAAWHAGVRMTQHTQPTVRS
jgi:hypothetical protein